MPAKSDRPLTHVHWRVYTEDVERLHALFAHDHGAMSRAIRAMVHSFLNHNYATLHAKIDELEGRQQHGQDSSDRPRPASLPAQDIAGQ